MTVKELKEQLNKYEDNMLVMIPRSDAASDTNFPYRSVQFVSRGVNECDMCLFLEDTVCCDTCINDGYDPEEGPCANCSNYDEWEELK
jgi:hypothetical protein